MTDETDEGSRIKTPHLGLDCSELGCRAGWLLSKVFSLHKGYLAGAWYRLFSKTNGEVYGLQSSSKRL